MKRVITLCLVILLGVLLTGCVDGREQAIESAIEMEIEKFYNDIEDNILTAEEIYSKDFYKMYGQITEITKEDIIIKVKVDHFNDICFKVKFSEEDSKIIMTGEYINFVVRIEAIERFDDVVYVTAKKAYYIDNVTEMECYIGYIGEKSVVLSKDSYYRYDYDALASVSLTEKIPEHLIIETDDYYSWNEDITKWALTINGVKYKKDDRIYIKFIRRDKEDISYILDIKKLED